MPDNTVSIVFEANTTPFLQAFKDINKELESASSSAGPSNFGKGIEEGAKKAGAAAKGASEHVGLFGKAAEGAKEKMKGFGEEIASTVFKYVGLVGIVEAAIHAFELASDKQAISVRLQNILGEGATEVSEGLEVANKKLSYSYGELGASVQKLSAAGIPTEKLVEDVSQLGERARIAGVPLESMVELYARISMKGEEGMVSIREMNELAMQSADQRVTALAREYSGLERTLELTNTRIAKESELQQRAHTSAMQQEADARSVASAHMSAVNLFAEATGADKEAFSSFKAYGAGSSQTRLGGQLQKQYAGGEQEIAEESGVSMQEVQAAVAKGQISAAQLVSENEKRVSRLQETADKADERAQKAKEQAATDLQAQNVLTEKARQQAIPQAVGSLLTMPSAEVDKRLHAQQGTAEGKLQRDKADLERAGEALGGPLVEHLDELKVAVIGLTTAMVFSRMSANLSSAVAAGEGRALGAASAAAAGGLGAKGPGMFAGAMQSGGVALMTGLTVQAASQMSDLEKHPEKYGEAAERKELEKSSSQGRAFWQKLFEKGTKGDWGGVIDNIMTGKVSGAGTSAAGNDAGITHLKALVDATKEQTGLLRSIFLT